MWEQGLKEVWALKNWCFWTVVLEKTLENSLDCKAIQLVHPQGNQSFMFIGRTDAEAEILASWCKELTHWKRSWCWERLKVGGEGDNRGWDGWMASLTWWTRVCRWWRTGMPGMLQSMELQRVRHNWKLSNSKDIHGYLYVYNKVNLRPLVSHWCVSFLCILPPYLLFLIFWNSTDIVFYNLSLNFNLLVSVTFSDSISTILTIFVIYLLSRVWLFCYRMYCSLPGSSAHGIFQTRILEQVTISYSRRSSQFSDWTHISCVFCSGRWVLYH